MDFGAIDRYTTAAMGSRDELEWTRRAVAAEARLVAIDERRHDRGTMPSKYLFGIAERLGAAAAAEPVDGMHTGTFDADEMRHIFNALANAKDEVARRRELYDTGDVALDGVYARYSGLAQEWSAPALDAKHRLGNG